MRILVAGNGWSPDQGGGLNRYVTNLSGAIEKTAPEQKILVLGPASEGPKGLQAVAPVTDPIWRRLFAFFRQVFRERDRPQVVVGHFALNLLPVLLAAPRTPVVFHFHGPWAEESRSTGRSRLNSAAKYLIERTVFARVDRFIVLSHAFKSTLVDNYKVAAERVSVIPPGVDLSAFTPRTEGAEPSSGSVRRVIVVRRLVKRMGIDDLLYSWQAAALEGAHLDIVGDGVERDSLEALAHDLGITESVTFHGYVDDLMLREMYARALVSVIPTRELEGFGLVSLEALASGVPVIASSVGGLNEALGDFSREWMFDAGNRYQLAQLLAKAWRQSDLLPSSVSCRQWAERYDWNTAAIKCLEVYEGAVIRGCSY